MDDIDDLYDLGSLDAFSGVDLTLWLRLVLIALAAAVVGVVALLAR